MIFTIHQNGMETWTRAIKYGAQRQTRLYQNDITERVYSIIAHRNDIHFNNEETAIVTLKTIKQLLMQWNMIYAAGLLKWLCVMRNGLE